MSAIIKKVKILFLHLLLLSLFISCGDPGLDHKNITSGFIYEDGIYSNTQQRKNLLVKELKDGSLIFAIRNSRNKILFQQSLNQTFSKYHYWALYVDINFNVWYYNSDYSSSHAILFNKKTQVYDIKDFCDAKLQLPEKFRKELKLKNKLNNCESLESHK